MELRFSAIPREEVAQLRQGGKDANGQMPHVEISDGDGVPCRHCLGWIEEGEEYLVLAYRPFPAPQPYAEIGPIFVHVRECARYSAEDQMPSRERTGSGRILRGYDANNRIVYGTGVVVPNSEIQDQATRILERLDVEYVHVRSATNNCYTLRIDRA